MVQASWLSLICAEDLRWYETVFYINTGQFIPCGKNSCALSWIVMHYVWSSSSSSSGLLSEFSYQSLTYLVHDFPLVDLLWNIFTWPHRSCLHAQTFWFCEMQTQKDSVMNCPANIIVDAWCERQIYIYLYKEQSLHEGKALICYGEVCRSTVASPSTCNSLTRFIVC